MPDKFASELRDRGVSLDRNHLEALHQLRLVVPLVRLRRDTRAIEREHRRHPRDAESAAHWHPTSRWDINDALENRRLFDPAHERFMSRGQLTRPLGDGAYETSIYLYSPQQLVHAPLIQDALRWVELRAKNDRWHARLTVHELWRRRWTDQAHRLRELVLAVLTLEPLYYSQVIGTLTVDSDRTGDWNTEFERFYAWRAKQPLGRPLRWLGVNAGWIFDAGVELLRLADIHDPLGDWAELVAHANPDRWNRLKGKARSAVDTRIAAEVLLRYHDDLVAAGRAKAIAEPPARFRGPTDSRLKRRRPLDAVLSDFGLSPHPRVLVVVEGATELTIFPRVMEVFGLRTDEDFIAFQEAAGVRRDLTPLVAYLGPRLGERRANRYFELVRPPTRILVVLDAEGPVQTREQRERRRQKWVDRLMQTLPRELQRDEVQARVIREQLDLLVDVATWNRRGDSFEFAHFTDTQLATTIDKIDDRERKPSFEKLLELVAQTRARGGNLKELLHGPSKLDLVDALWPLLERRLIRGRDAGSTSRLVPIVRILDHALELAHEFGRGSIVLALEPAPPGQRRRRSRRR
jgi:hypothetical protein